MKISLLVSDLSTNCVGRAYILAQVLNRYYDVEIIGPVFGKDIWPPAKTGELKFKPVPGNNYPKFINTATEIISTAKGQVIYALKPLATSYGLALLVKLKHHLPLVLDIDDWEVGFVKWNLAQSKKVAQHIRNPNWIGWTVLLDKFTWLADKITVSNRFLARRYNGYLVPHGRDVNFLDPARYDASALRRVSGLEEDDKIVLFLGTPRPHKGIEDLIKAVRTIKDKKIKILLVGADPEDPFVNLLMSQSGEFLHIVGMASLLERPKWLAIADMVVLPQHLSFASIGQTPAKLFDAMAMAKPIIATSVSDIPFILKGCGIVVPPGNLTALANGIHYVLDNPKEAAELGMAARQKCIQEYSWETMEKVLIEVFSEYE